MPQIAATLRSSVNRSTGFTPNHLMLGRELTMPAHLIYRQSFCQGGTEKENTEGFLSTLEGNLTEAHEVARTTLKMNQRQQKRNYDVRLRSHQYKKKYLVYILNQTSQKGVC